MKQHNTRNYRISTKSWFSICRILCIMTSKICSSKCSECTWCQILLKHRTPVWARSNLTERGTSVLACIFSKVLVNYKNHSVLQSSFFFLSQSWSIMFHSYLEYVFHVYFISFCKLALFCLVHFPFTLEKYVENYI